MKKPVWLQSHELYLLLPSCLEYTNIHVPLSLTWEALFVMVECAMLSLLPHHYLELPCASDLVQQWQTEQATHE